ncbi:MAG TPA: signal peptidase I [Acidimicrobiales bacterium]|nr:signal peptidase I [Acidimicrobiales bacterium]
MHWEPVVAPAEDQTLTRLPPVASPRPRTSRLGLVAELPVLLLVALLAAYGVRQFAFQTFYIPSPSMGCAECPVHTLEIDDKVVVSKLSYRLHDPRRGDVVVFECPPAAACTRDRPATNPVSGALRWVGRHVGLIPPSTEDYIKRVVALGGETVEGRDGHVYVDGLRLEEPYLPDGMVTADFAPVTVGEGQLWVMGDNRANSSDSRVFGPIGEDLVVGRTLFRLLPIPRIAFL